MLTSIKFRTFIGRDKMNKRMIVVLTILVVFLGLILLSGCQEAEYGYLDTVPEEEGNVHFVYRLGIPDGCGIAYKQLFTNNEPEKLGEDVVVINSVGLDVGNTVIRFVPMINIPEGPNCKISRELGDFWLNLPSDFAAKYLE